MYAMAIIRYRKPLEEELVHQDAHRAYLRGLKEKGTLIASGPMNPRFGGMLLLPLMLIGFGVNVWMPLFGPLPKPDWFGVLAKLVYIIGLRLTGAVLANVFVQYNDLSQAASVNCRVNWHYRPGSDIFLVYNQTWDGPTVSALNRRDRQVMLKVTRLLQR